MYADLQANRGYGITGCSKAMYANRISFWLGLTGPSYTIDSGCSSSIFAIENAYRAIRSGQCDGALVGAASLCLHPHMALQFVKLGDNYYFLLAYNFFYIIIYFLNFV